MSVSRKRRKSKLQKEARKIQHCQANKKKCSTGRKLTSEQKIKRKTALEANKLRKEKRKLLESERQESELIKKFNTAMASIFSEASLEFLAKTMGFKQRKGVITPFAFIYILSMGFLGNGHIALCYLTDKLANCFKIIISPQALCKRINSKKSVKFTKSVLVKVMESQLALSMPNTISTIFSMFNGVYIQDSSQVVLNEELADGFKGSGGAGSKSALKLDFIFDITKYLINEFTLTEGSVNDQTLSKNILKQIKKNSLVIRDLGYFSLDVLSSISKKGAFYISRLSISTYVYLNKEDEEPINLPKYLKKLQEIGSEQYDFTIYIGKSERFETRLIGEKVPDDVVKQRAKRFKKERKKEPSQDYIEWCGYSFFITNIEKSMCFGQLIISIYKIRWQIELAFKAFKTTVQINVLKGTNENRIENLVYGKLITIVMMFMIQNFAQHVANDKEVSCDKLAKHLKTDDKLQRAVLNNEFGMLLIFIEYDIKTLCKQKRGRQTTLEQIRDKFQQNEEIRAESIVEVSFDEIFSEIPAQKVV